MFKRQKTVSSLHLLDAQPPIPPIPVCLYRCLPIYFTKHPLQHVYYKYLNRQDDKPYQEVHDP